MFNRLNKPSKRRNNDSRESSMDRELSNCTFQPKLRRGNGRSQSVNRSRYKSHQEFYETQMKYKENKLKNIAHKIHKQTKRQRKSWSRGRNRSNMSNRTDSNGMVHD